MGHETESTFKIISKGIFSSFGMKRIILIAGFESFNADLYKKAAELAKSRCPLDIRVFSDRNITTDPGEVEAALDGADVFFGSLLFDYDQVLWLRSRINQIPIRLVFESALELMSLTQLGNFTIGGQPKGMPKPVKFILDKFSNGREEDKLAGSDYCRKGCTVSWYGSR